MKAAKALPQWWSKVQVYTIVLQRCFLPRGRCPDTRLGHIISFYLFQHWEEVKGKMFELTILLINTHAHVLLFIYIHNPSSPQPPWRQIMSSVFLSTFLLFSNTVYITKHLSLGVYWPNSWNVTVKRKSEDFQDMKCYHYSSASKSSVLWQVYRIRQDLCPSKLRIYWWSSEFSEDGIRVQWKELGF